MAEWEEELSFFTTSAGDEGDSVRFTMPNVEDIEIDPLDFDSFRTSTGSEARNQERLKQDESNMKDLVDALKVEESLLDDDDAFGEEALGLLIDDNPENFLKGVAVLAEAEEADAGIGAELGAGLKAELEAV